MIEKNSPKKEILKRAKICNRCGKCCRYSSGFVLPDEVKRIAKFLSLKEEELKERYLEKLVAYNRDVYKVKPVKKPFGECMFLEDGLCRIHEVKPLMCRIANCKEEDNIEWFLLNHIIMPYDRTSIREWSVRLKTHKTIKGGEIEELIPDKTLRDSLLHSEHDD